MVLFVVFRRYKRAIRDLSDKEVEEFFKGRQDVLSNNRCPTSEQIEHMPYNEDLEVQYDDIEFGN